MPRVRCVGDNQIVGEMFKKTLRRRIASSKGGEMIRIFKIVVQHVAFKILKRCLDMCSVPKFVAPLRFLVLNVDIGKER